jgi:hypothetical protein
MSVRTSDSFFTTSQLSAGDEGVVARLVSVSGPEDAMALSPPGVIASKPEPWLSDRRCDFRAAGLNLGGLLFRSLTLGGESSCLR